MSIIPKTSWIQKITFFLLMFFFFFPALEPARAAYSPGETLNPTCRPTDSGCTVHSTMSVTNGGTGLTSLGSDGQILKVSGNSLAWSDATSIVDADDDTQIHVEKSENANRIHFDLGGSSPIENALTIDQISGLVWNIDNNNLDFSLAGTNNDHVFYLEASTDSVGIGTNNPENKLHVEGVDSGLAGVYLNNAVPSDTSYTLYNNSGTLTWNGTALAVGSSVSGTTNYISKFTSSNSLGNSVIYDDGTNVGIGDASPVSLLTVGFGDVFQVNSSGGIAAATGITSSGTITFSGLTTNGIVTVSGGALSSSATLGSNYITDDSLDFTELADSLTLDASTDISVTGTNVLSITNTGTGNSFLVNDQSSDTTPFVIDANGNVGVGTGTLDAKLDILDTTNQTALEINSSATTNNAVEIYANSLTGGDGLHVYSSSSDISTRHLVEIFQQNANASNAVPLYVHSNDLDGNLVQLLGGTVTHNYQTTGGTAHAITADSLTTGTGLSVASSSLTTGRLANFYSNSSDISSRYLVSVHNDDSASTGAIPLRIIQDAAATGIVLTQNANATGLDIYNPGNTSAYGFSIHGNNHTTGGLGYHYSTSTDTSSRNLYSIINSSSAATGTTVLSLTQNSTGSALKVDGVGTTIGNLLDVDGGALTTGRLAHFYSDSGDSNSRNLVEIHNDSASASGAVALYLNQDANSNAMYVDGDGVSTGNILEARGNGLTTGSILSLHSAASNNNSRRLVEISNSSSGATSAVPLYITQSAVGQAVQIESAGTALFANSSATVLNVIDINANSSTLGSAISVTSTSDNASNRNIAEIIQDSTLATGATALYIQQESTGLALDADGDVDINGDLTLSGDLQHTGELYDLNKTWSFDPGSVSTIYTQYLGTFSVTGGPVTVELRDSGVNHGSSSKFEIVKQYGTLNVPIVTALDGSFYADYTIYYRNVDNENYELFWDTSNTDTGSTISYEAWVTHQGTVTDSLSFSNDAGISASTIAMVANRSGWVGLGKVGPGAMLDMLSTGTTSNGLQITADSLTTGSIANFTSASTNTSTRNLVEITNDDSAATGTTALYVDQDANQNAVMVDANGVTDGIAFEFSNLGNLTTGRAISAFSNSSSGGFQLANFEIGGSGLAGSNAMRLVHSGAGRALAAIGRVNLTSNSTTVDHFEIVGDTVTTADVIDVSGDALTVGSLASFNSNSSNTSARNLVEIINDNTAAIGAVGLHIQQDADEEAINISSTGTGIDMTAAGTGLNISSTSTTGDVIDVAADSLTTGHLMELTSNSSDTTSRQLIRLENQNSAAIGTMGIYISQAANNESLYINSTGTTTNDVMFVSGNNLTTGGLASFDSDSSDTSTRNVFEIINDNAAADSATALYIQQDGDEDALNIVAGGVSADDVMTVTGNSLTSGGLALFYSNSSSGTARNLVEVINNNSTASSTNALYLQNNASGGYLISGTSAGGGISMTTTGESVGYSFTHTTDAHHNVFNISGPNTDTANILEVTGNFLTSGALGRFYTTSSNVTNAVEIVVNSANTDSRALYVQNASSNANAVAFMTDGRVGINDPTPSTYVLTVDWNGDGNNYAYVNNSNAWTSGSADYAEYYYTKDTDLEPGETVCIDTDRENAVKRCENEADNNLMGIISTSPAFLGNAPGDEKRQDNPNYVIVAMLGQVPAKVTNENGAIEPGDSLTSADKSGYIMKADDGDPTVGVALEGSDDTTDTINVLISRRNKGLTIAQMEEEISAKITKIEMDGLNFAADTEQQQLSNMAMRLAAADQALINVSEQLTLLKAELAGGEMALELGELEVSGGVTFKSEVEFQGPAVFKALVHFIDEVVFKNDVKFAGDVEMEEDLTVNSVTFNADTAGYAVIKEGDTKVEVIFEEEYVEVPVITATLRSSIKLDWYRVTDESEKGFVIEIDSKEDKDIKFAWTAIAVEDVKTTESEEKGEDEESEEEENKKDKEETTREEEVPTSQTSDSTAETGDSSSESKTGEDTDDENADEDTDEAETESFASDESGDDESE